MNLTTIPERMAALADTVADIREAPCREAVAGIDILAQGILDALTLGPVDPTGAERLARYTWQALHGARVVLAGSGRAHQYAEALLALCTEAMRGLGDESDRRLRSAA